MIGSQSDLFSHGKNVDYTCKFTEAVALWFPCVPVKNEPVGEVGTIGLAERAQEHEFICQRLPKAYDLANRFESAYKLLFAHGVGHIADYVAERINERSSNVNKILAHRIPLLTLKKSF